MIDKTRALRECVYGVGRVGRARGQVDKSDGVGRGVRPGGGAEDKHLLVELGEICVEVQPGDRMVAVKDQDLRAFERDAQ